MQCGCCRPLVDAARPVTSLHCRHSITQQASSGSEVSASSRFNDPCQALSWRTLPEEVPV